MKKLILISLLVIMSQIIFAQKLTIKDFHNIIKKENGTEINQYLNAKDWEFSGTENTQNNAELITWSKNKVNNGNSAMGWLKLWKWIDEKSKEKRFFLKYTVYNKVSYNTFVESIKLYNYKFEKDIIMDNGLTSVYRNEKYTLEVQVKNKNNKIEYIMLIF